MENGRPSRTALGAAFHRAAHQVLENGSIFFDPLATRVLGEALPEALRRAQEDPSRRPLRLFIAARHRFAEDAIARALERGARQVVALGAGLDTYAYRATLPQGARVFEVDHPATQAWKRQLLARAEIALPPELTFAPIDFERQNLGEGLRAAGFDPARQTFFSWLGVVPYLTEQAVFATLGLIGGMAGGAHVCFDYANPPGDGADDAAAQALAERVARAGEPFQCFLETSGLHQRLRGLGFRAVDDLGPAAILERFFPSVERPRRERGAHILYAATAGD